MTQRKQDGKRPVSDMSRRGFVSRAGATGIGLVIPAWVAAEQRSGSPQPKGAAHEEEDVAPPEDLMREHGVLKRVLLIYEEAIRRIDAKQQLPPDPIKNSAQIIRSFIEDYHEKLEEDYLFPRFEKAKKLVDLTTVLRTQHQAGRTLTDQITQLATAASLKDSSSSGKLREAMRQFVRMYAPHEAREDTVLFPALRTIVSKNEFDALGEDFEKKEHQLFGEDGFEKMVDRVASIERALGIYDLAQFTPHV
jgi:hemerythrin-like domain-containing protein